MKSPSYIRFLMTCVISFLIISTDVTADDPKPSTLNKSQAAQKAQQKVNGRVLKVDQNKHKYQVKLLQKSGRVVSVNVDKKSGKVSQQGSKN